MDHISPQSIASNVSPGASILSVYKVSVPVQNVTETLCVKENPTPKQPLATSALDGFTPKQSLHDVSSKQLLDDSISKQPLDGPTSKQPLDDPTSKQPLDDPTSKQPLDDPTSKQPLDDPTSKQPLDGPTSKQALDGPTSKQPLDDPTFEQSLDDSISKQPLAESFPRKSSLVGSESQSLESTEQHLNSLYTTAKLSNEALTCTQPLDSATSLRSSESHSLDEYSEMSSTHCFLRTENRCICHGVVRCRNFY